jgi:hypothetical protein
MNLISLGQKGNQVQPGIGYRVTQTPGGTTVSAIKKRAPSQYAHPFKFSVSNEEGENRLYINYGAIYRMIVSNNPSYPDSVANACWISIPQSVTSFTFQNEPQGASDFPTYNVLSAGTNYGVWITGTIQTQSTVIDAYAPSDEMGYTEADIYSPAFGLSVVVSSTYTLPADAPSDRSLWFYLGKIEVDSSGNATIMQYWRSDIILPSISLPRVTPSSDTGNSVEIGSDGLLFVAPIVSADADNSISEGTDGGAFYEAPPAVSADSNNSITTGTDGGPFYDAPPAVSADADNSITAGSDGGPFYNAP